MEYLIVRRICGSYQRDFTRLFRWHPSGGKLVGKWQSYKATGYESRNGHVYKELDGDYLGDVIESYSGVGE